MRKYLSTVILIFSINFAGLAFEKGDTVNINITSPYESIFNHIKFLEDENFHPEKAAMSLDTDGFSSKEAEDLAIKLKHYFDGRGYFIDLDEIPKESNYIDTLTNQARFYPIEDKDIYLKRTEKGWQYSEKTVSLINAKHKELFPYGTELIVDIIPKKGHKKFMGLYIWQHLGILFIILFGFITHKIAPIFLRKALFNILRRTANDAIDLKRYSPVANMASLFILSIVVSLLFPVLQLPINISKNIILIFRGLTPFLGMLIAYRMVDLLGIYMQKMAERTESTLDDQLVPLVRKALKIFVVVIGLLFILQNLNFNITALLAGISIGGLAFALAAQDTIKNLFGSLMIFLDKPFQAGDWISSGEIDGTVEEVGFRSTRLRTFTNSVISVPNGRLADATINNHGLRKFRRYHTKLSITYDTPPQLIEVFVEGLRKLVKDNPNINQEMVRVYLNDFADSSILILINVFFDVPDANTELECRQQFMLQIINLAEKLNVRFAFPTQTIHVENLPGQPTLTPSYDLKDRIFRKDDSDIKSLEK